ncbi:Hypothetical predicted protein, partial [Marmota monax]
GGEPSKMGGGESSEHHRTQGREDAQLQEGEPANLGGRGRALYTISSRVEGTPPSRAENPQSWVTGGGE